MSDEKECTNPIPWSFTDVCKGLSILVVAFGVAGSGLATLIVAVRTHDKVEAVQGNVESVQKAQVVNSANIVETKTAAVGAEKAAKSTEATVKGETP